MKRVIASAMLMLIFGFCIGFVALASEDITTTSEAYIPSETETKAVNLEVDSNVKLVASTVERVNSEDQEVIKNCLQDASDRMIAAQQMADGARGLNYKESNAIIQLAKQEWESAHEDYIYYAAKLEELKKAEEDRYYAEKSAEYPVATYIWRYFKDLGYSDYVCAGLLGNFMAEVGGQTLDIQYWLGGNGYYGIAQWSTTYYSAVNGCSLEEQCKYLAGNIKEVINAYGNYNTFIALTDERQAALMFAKTYERCDSGSYYIRQRNATIAYEYFVE